MLDTFWEVQKARGEKGKAHGDKGCEQAAEVRQEIG